MDDNYGPPLTDCITQPGLYYSIIRERNKLRAEVELLRGKVEKCDGCEKDANVELGKMRAKNETLRAEVERLSEQLDSYADVYNDISKSVHGYNYRKPDDDTDELVFAVQQLRADVDKGIACIVDLCAERDAARAELERLREAAGLVLAAAMVTDDPPSMVCPEAFVVPIRALWKALRGEVKP